MFVKSAVILGRTSNDTTRSTRGGDPTVARNFDEVFHEVVTFCYKLSQVLAGASLAWDQAP